MNLLKAIIRGAKVVTAVSPWVWVVLVLGLYLRQFAEIAPLLARMVHR